MTKRAKKSLEEWPFPARIHYAKSRLAGNLYKFLTDQNLSLEQMSARTGASQEALTKLFNEYECHCTFDQLIEYLFRADHRAQIVVRRERY